MKEEACVFAGLLVGCGYVWALAVHAHFALAALLFTIQLAMLGCGILMNVSVQSIAVLAVALGMVVWSIAHAVACADGGVYSVLGLFGFGAERCVTWTEWLASTAVTTTGVTILAPLVDNDTNSECIWLWALMVVGGVSCR
jgi:hypothetical protein